MFTEYLGNLVKKLPVASSTWSASRVPILCSWTWYWSAVADCEQVNCMCFGGGSNIVMGTGVFDRTRTLSPQG